MDKNILVNQTTVKCKIFLIKSSLASALFIGIRVSGIEKKLGATRNCGRWSDIETF